MKDHRRALTILAASTAIAGVLGAFALAAGLPIQDRTFATVAAPVQLLISVGVPFLGAVATSSLHRESSPDARGTIVRAVSWALGLAVLGLASTAAAVAILSSPATNAVWARALPVVLGSLLVQVVAVLIGTGLGFLLRRPVLASLATVVLPLALFLLLTPVAGVRLWLTPLEGANLLLAGTMSSTEWVPYLVMLCIWVVGLNVAGLRRFNRPADRGKASPDPEARRGI